MRIPSLVLSLGSLALGSALGAAIVVASATSFAMFAPKPPVIPKNPVVPTMPLPKPAATTFLSNQTVAELAKVPVAKLLPGTVLSADTTIVGDMSIAFHCASWVQPRFDGAAANVLFHASNQCGGYGTYAVVWIKAQTDKKYMVECAGSSQKWQLVEDAPGGVGQETTFNTATTRPYMEIRPMTAGWHGVRISVPSIPANDSYTLTKCRVTPVAK
jgi:hypothetical protein